MMATFGDRMRAEINKYKNNQNNEIIKNNEQFINKIIEKCKSQMEDNIIYGIDTLNIEYSLITKNDDKSKLIVHKEIIRRLTKEGLIITVKDNDDITTDEFQIKISLE